jgi:hypothetical protein
MVERFLAVLMRSMWIFSRLDNERPTRISGDYSRLLFRYVQSDKVVSIIHRYNEAAVPC